MNQGQAESVSVEEHVYALCQAAREASQVLRSTPAHDKNKALLAMAEALDSRREALKQANQLDLDLARAQGLDKALIDRLALTDERIDGMIKGLSTVASLADPVGALDQVREQANGLRIGKRRTPIGVIGIIYESRPNVTIDAAALCLKAGNAAVLRGGSEARHSNAAIAGCVKDGLAVAGLPDGSVSVIGTTDRAAVGALITASKLVDLIIPRGGKSLITRISNEATIPVLKHLEGLCHVYIDAQAQSDAMAMDIAFNAKCYRYGICGAMETLLVHRDRAAAILPALVSRLVEHGVEVRGCDTVQSLVAVHPATVDDWSTEYLGPVLAVRVVNDLDEAIAHINHYGSHHSDAIVTDSLTASERFMAEVDSSSVMVNAPTCFADGGEYGLGAEIGISTDKLHARGPVGLEGLTTQKYIVIGQGQCRG
ncbi:glutamate-5-semialdehyde dehydrogenase [Larsenimonas rhizosphaerae]|uniref:Gamma-glutamyl phosphate reductase n=1 Tax=Larsenimonas rhizosphaerae TaxID=2944682 RepID=A0AA41ZME0_9GAMM|nr:glutamate-5-semialdehyde dehydrogenase [Larsenimonas rhizosphaerae]MCM2130841.1 glutamate-5-semialdehyde dehydrogenase [Larsenimonas rhizosphaerae]MCX2523545.1 glutamate-5-semialdehyde dehydrogenase [Larsenimonas rhizosphaerae]